MKTISVQTGGKLYIAGEYAILTPGQTAIIKNIPIYMTAQVREARTIHLFSDMFDAGADMTPNSDYSLIQQTIKTLAACLGKSLEALPALTFVLQEKWSATARNLVLAQVVQ